MRISAFSIYLFPASACAEAIFKGAIFYENQRIKKTFLSIYLAIKPK
jgi:hypothetical protein